MRHLEPSRLPPDGPGEGASLVTEQLRFKQPVWDGRTIDGDKRSARARAERVQRARKQLLARSALSFKQDRGVGAGDVVQPLQDMPQLRILADDSRGAVPFGQLLFQHDVFGEDAALRRPIHPHPVRGWS